MKTCVCFTRARRVLLHPPGRVPPGQRAIVLYLRDVCCTAHLTQSATGTAMYTCASHQVISRDVLHNLTEDEREQIWAHRHKLVHVPEVCGCPRRDGTYMCVVTS